MLPVTSGGLRVPSLSNEISILHETPEDPKSLNLRKVWEAGLAYLKGECTDFRFLEAVKDEVKSSPTHVHGSREGVFQACWGSQGRSSEIVPN